VWITHFQEDPVDPNSKSVSAFYLEDAEYEEQESTTGEIKSIVLNTHIVF
jgi:hypothetical protein